MGEQAALGIGDARFGGGGVGGGVLHGEHLGEQAGQLGTLVLRALREVRGDDALTLPVSIGLATGAVRLLLPA